MKFLDSVRVKASIALLLAGLLFGLSSPLAKSMGLWLLPFSVVFIRFFFALPFAAGFAIFSSADKPQKSKKLPFWQLCFFAALFPISVCLYTFSLFYTKVSLAIFSFYVANVVSSILLGLIFNKEKVTKKKLLGFVLAIGAVLCFTNPLQGFAIGGGMLFGYLSGVFQSVASLYQKRLSKITSEKALTLTQIMGGLGVSGLAIWFTRDLSLLSLSGSGTMLGLLFGFLFFLINYLMIYGFKRADLGVGTILLSSELVFGPVAAYLLFREALTSRELFGGLLIIVAVIIVSHQGGSMQKRGAKVAT